MPHPLDAGPAYSPTPADLRAERQACQEADELAELRAQCDLDEAYEIALIEAEDAALDDQEVRFLLLGEAA